jgi:hypothetical protein
MIGQDNGISGFSVSTCQPKSLQRFYYLFDDALNFSDYTALNDKIIND